MSQSLEDDDLWDLAFSNVGREDDGQRNDDDVARTIYTICGITPTSCEAEEVTGAW